MTQHELGEVVDFDMEDVGEGGTLIFGDADGAGFGASAVGLGAESALFWG